MPDDDVSNTTVLLKRVVAGDLRAQELLYASVSAELRRIAGGLMRDQPAGHTLQPTALVNEAWIRLVGSEERSYAGRRHFLGVASKAMRSILVDHVRAKRARKRGAAVAPGRLDEVVACLEAANTDLLDLEQALAELERDDPELAQLVELRFFGGLSQPEIARVLEVSLSTVERYWRLARARLHRRLDRGGATSDELE